MDKLAGNGCLVLKKAELQNDAVALDNTAHSRCWSYWTKKEVRWGRVSDRSRLDRLIQANLRESNMGSTISNGFLIPRPLSHETGYQFFGRGGVEGGGGGSKVSLCSEGFEPRVKLGRADRPTGAAPRGRSQLHYH